MDDAVQEPEGGIDTTLAAAFAGNGGNDEMLLRLFPWWLSLDYQLFLIQQIRDDPLGK